MKKTVLILAGLVAGTSLSAQTGEITSNRGENWLSESGDWSLGIDAHTFIDYVGDLFNGTNDNNDLEWMSPSLPMFANDLSFGGSNVVITGKKLIDSNTAYRAKVRIGFGSTKNTEFVSSLPGTDPVSYVDDVTKIGYSAIVIGAGLEKRVGSTRIVGIYGGELCVGFGGMKTTFDYGNPLSDDNPVSRTTESKQGSALFVGLNAFGGVEWFCAPKVSLGAEYTWGLGLASQGAGSSTTETWNGDGIDSESVDGTPNDGYRDKTSSFTIDTGYTSFMLNFYFQ